MKTTRERINWAAIEQCSGVKEVDIQLMRVLTVVGAINDVGEMQPKTSQIAAVLCVAPSTISDRMTRLKACGVLKEVPSHKGNNARRFKFSDGYFTPGISETLFTEYTDDTDGSDDSVKSMEDRLAQLKIEEQQLKAQLDEAKARQIVQFNVNIPRPLRQRIDDLRGSMTTSDVAREALEQWVEGRESEAVPQLTAVRSV